MRPAPAVAPATDRCGRSHDWREMVIRIASVARFGLIRKHASYFVKGLMRTLELPAPSQRCCGEERMCVTTAPTLTMACHCRGCQQMSASAFSMSAANLSQGLVAHRSKSIVGGMSSPELAH